MIIDLGILDKKTVSYLWSLSTYYMSLCMGSLTISIYILLTLQHNCPIL